MLTRSCATVSTLFPLRLRKSYIFRMLSHNYSFLSCVVYFLIFLIQYNGTSGLQNVRISATSTVIKGGDSMSLTCEYDLEDADLYSIKWYFNGEEFYKFVPKENPPKYSFPLSSGLKLDLSKSDNKVVTLHKMVRKLSGYYTCEISADAPYFHTAVVQINIDIIEPPEGPPLLLVEKMKYSGNESIKANCTSSRAFPAANLTWFVNDHKVSDLNSSLVKYQTSVNEEGLESSFSTLQVRTTPALFSEGKLTLVCEADQYEVYSESASLTLSEDVPQLAHVLSPTSRSASYCDYSGRKILMWLTLLISFRWRYYWETR